MGKYKVEFQVDLVLSGDVENAKLDVSSPYKIKYGRGRAIDRRIEVNERDSENAAFTLIVWCEENEDEIYEAARRFDLMVSDLLTGLEETAFKISQDCRYGECELPDRKEMRPASRFSVPKLSGDSLKQDFEDKLSVVCDELFRVAADRQEVSDDLMIVDAKSRYLVEGSNPERIARILERYYSVDTQARDRWRRIGIQRRPPVWAYLSVSAVTLAFVMSFLGLGDVTVCCLIGLLIGVNFLGVVLPPRFGSSRLFTLFGLVPVSIFLGFAIIYGFAMIQENPRILLETPGGLHVGDPLLLSVGMTATAGALDMSVSGWARNAVLAQLLLLISFFGSAAILVFRRTQTWADESIQAIRLERPN